MREIILLFRNADISVDDTVKRCIEDLIPCQAKLTDDKKGVLIKKAYTNGQEFTKIMEIKEKYGLTVEYDKGIYYAE